MKIKVEKLFIAANVSLPPHAPGVPPRITAVRPSRLQAGEVLYIYGRNFDHLQGANKLELRRTGVSVWVETIYGNKHVQRTIRPTPFSPQAIPDSRSRIGTIASTNRVVCSSIVTSAFPQYQRCDAR